MRERKVGTIGRREADIPVFDSDAVILSVGDSFLVYFSREYVNL